MFAGPPKKRVRRESYGQSTVRVHNPGVQAEFDRLAIRGDSKTPRVSAAALWDVLLDMQQRRRLGRDTIHEISDWFNLLLPGNGEFSPELPINTLPTLRRHFKSSLPNHYAEYYVCPNECDSTCYPCIGAVQPVQPACTTCNSPLVDSPNRRLCHFPVKAQLDRLFALPELQQYFNVDPTLPTSTCTMRDFRDSPAWRELILRGLNGRTAVLGLTMDGVPIAKGKRGQNKNTLCIVSAELLNLPPHLRYQTL